MTNTNKYRTQRVAARNLRVGTVCYHWGEVVNLQPYKGVGVTATFKDGRTVAFGYPDRIRIYPNL